MLHSEEVERLIKVEAAKFPAEFGLRAYPGKRFKILLHESYADYHTGKVTLYTGVQIGDKWPGFAKGTTAELLAEVVALIDVNADLAKKHPTIYDYANQAWVVDGKYMRCGHVEAANCTCYGMVHHGEPADMARIVEAVK